MARQSVSGSHPPPDRACACLNTEAAARLSREHSRPLLRAREKYTTTSSPACVRAKTAPSPLQITMLDCTLHHDLPRKSSLNWTLDLSRMYIRASPSNREIASALSFADRRLSSLTCRPRQLALGQWELLDAARPSKPSFSFALSATRPHRNPVAKSSRNVHTVAGRRRPSLGAVRGRRARR